jgi:hypothetical protein
LQEKKEVERKHIVEKEKLGEIGEEIGLIFLFTIMPSRILSLGRCLPSQFFIYDK